MSDKPVLDPPPERHALKEEGAVSFASWLIREQITRHTRRFPGSGRPLARGHEGDFSRDRAVSVGVAGQGAFDSPTAADMAAVIARNGTNKAEQEDLGRMLRELETLSDEDAQRLIQNETKPTATKV
jgi:hypothetical protein